MEHQVDDLTESSNFLNSALKLAIVTIRGGVLRKAFLNSSSCCTALVSRYFCAPVMASKVDIIKIQHNNDMAHNSVITLANDHSEENKLLFF
ncbi:hypothetical protein MSG28_013666 [Choristoneura fumiferana]|uniref:Uncharacterized protein n=1 Tax=Choristoneura fumiferana TaxID=7141 RepID=A0ACC0K8G8_CHOFU|nr:hypothetical protein MSG28_013666 [Choristoneura fumiferana]